MSNRELIQEQRAKPQPVPFDEYAVIHDLKHYLPAQAPLKDFIHYNTLHTFQELPFYKGIHSTSAIFGYKVSLSLDKYRGLYAATRISEPVLTQVITRRKGPQAVADWTEKLLNGTYQTNTPPRIGAIRSFWKKKYRVDLDALVHSLLFRILSNYLDQGISIWGFPVGQPPFWVPSANWNAPATAAFSVLNAPGNCSCPKRL